MLRWACPVPWARQSARRRELLRGTSRTLATDAERWWLVSGVLLNPLTKHRQSSTRSSRLLFDAEAQLNLRDQDRSRGGWLSRFQHKPANGRSQFFALRVADVSHILIALRARR